MHDRNIANTELIEGTLPRQQAVYTFVPDSLGLAPNRSCRRKAFIEGGVIGW